MAEQDSLVFELNDLYESLTALRDYYSSVTSKSSVTLIEAKFQRFNEIKSEYSDLKRRIFQFNSQVEAVKSRVKLNSSSFHDMFDSILESHLKLTSKVSTQTSQSSHSPSNFSAGFTQIDLPKFNGEIENWQNFKSLYDSLVHCNANIPVIQKFHILRSKLEDQAASLIANIQLDEVNYKQAYDILKDRYASSRRLIHYYLSQILNYTNSNEPKTYSNFLSAHLNSIGAIKALQLNDSLDAILFCLAYQNLNFKDKHEFDNTYDSSKVPSCEDLMEFIKKRAQSFDLHSDVKVIDKSRNKHSKEKPKTSLSLVSNNEPNFKQSHARKVKDEPLLKCPVCSSTDHKIYTCSTFLKLSLNEKYDKIKLLHRCFKCLGFHNKRDCSSNSVCKTCQSDTHHTLLHSDNVQPICNLTNKNSNSTILLSTIEVDIKDSCGFFHTVKAVLDNGSQVNAITHSLSKKLGLHCSNTSSSVTGISSTQVYSRQETNCLIRSSHQWRTKVEFNALIVEHICPQLPSTTISNDVVQRFESLHLADKTFYKPSNIDILLGAEIYAQILTNDSPIIIPGYPTAINSTFGYFLSGKVLTTPSSVSLLINNISLEENIRKFWEIENTVVSQPLNTEDVLAEKHFSETVSRTCQGRFQVLFCFKPNVSPIGSNRDIALKRFLNLEKRLLKDPDTKQVYDDFFHEYHSLGHMRPTVNKSEYILPHFYIRKPLSSSQVIRAVFDGSALDQFNCSLNSKLCTGPKLQKDLPQIIDSFRQHNITLCCDIQKLFRNILVGDEHKKYQHIFWRSNPKEPVTEWELQTVCYGLSNSPFLAQRCLSELVTQETASNNNFKLAAYSLQHHCYIDDVITGQPDVESAKQLMLELTQLLGKGCFKIKKWSSNCTELLSSLNFEDKEKVLFFSDETIGIKILGLLWDPTTDVFSYHVAPFSGKVTKRNVLSYISKIFDCNGFIGPVILKSKKFIQDFWLQGISWDEEVQDPLKSDWLNFVSEFPLLSKLKIPRKIFYPNGIFRLIGFCDACEYGIGAAVYLHVVQDNISQCFLLRTKTRVAPLKSLTIPKLELCGALLLVKLVKNITGDIFPFPLKEIIYLTDSQVVLSWLRISPHLLQTFVSNRIVQILEFSTPTQWFHIKSEDNCSDICSRGASPTKLLNSHMYWYGPSFVNKSIDEWPIYNYHKLDVVPELKKIKSSLLTANNNLLNPVVEDIKRFSSLPKLQRVFAYCLRFLNNIKKSNIKLSGPLTHNELHNGLMACVKLTQNDNFFQEIELIKKGERVPDSFRKLSPFLNEEGILLVGGRLENSSLPNYSKHPILLSSKSHLAQLLCDYYHIYTCHSGIATVQAMIQQRWWILALRSLLKRRIFMCLRCYKLKAKPVAPYMAPLPGSRVQATSCFHVTGMDFFGYLEIKESLRRNSRTYKGYGLILICFATKAIHIELVSSLSTQAFIAAIDRFTSRRGLPLELNCDCGTSFVGASRELKEIQNWLTTNQNSIFSSLAARQIRFKFNCPTAASMGGLWESGVKSAKTLFYRMIGSTKLTFEEYVTVFSRIEAVLNSRPLCYLSATPDDGTNYLSPGHFLIGKPILNFPEVLISEDLSLTSRWQRLRQIVQGFWNRWSKEYLNTQIHRSKWTEKRSNFSVGDIVLLSNLKTTPLSWPLGKVIEVFPGPDSIVRVVKVKIINGIYTRPVNKLVALPMV